MRVGGPGLVHVVEAQNTCKIKIHTPTGPAHPWGSLTEPPAGGAGYAAHPTL